MTWRHTILIHPEADEFPLLDTAELKALADDIKENGLRNPIAVALEGADTILVDGRNRLDALEQNGEPIFDKKGRLLKKLYCRVSLPEASAYIASANLHRRHLSKDEKLQLAAKMLATTPDMSNRAIGERVKLHHQTVAKRRAAMEASGEIIHITHPKARNTPNNPQKPKPPVVCTESGDEIDLTRASEKVKAQIDAAKWDFDKMDMTQLTAYGEKLKGKMAAEELKAFRAAVEALPGAAALATVQAQTASPPIAPADEPDIRILLGSADDALHAGKDALDNMQSHNHDADTLARLVSEANKVVAIWQRVQAEAPAPERQLTPDEISDEALVKFKKMVAELCNLMTTVDEAKALKFLQTPKLWKTKVIKANEMAKAA